MKPRNFPARKLARQIAAALRYTASEVYNSHLPEITEARAIRTKKRR